MSRNGQCKKVSELPGYEQARLWWRSRTPEEKSSLLSTQRYLFFPAIILELPVPLQGYLVMKKRLNEHVTERTVLLGNKQVDRLRHLYKTANKKGWTVQQDKGLIRFVRPGRVVRVDCERSERFLWP